MEVCSARQRDGSERSESDRHTWLRFKIAVGVRISATFARSSNEQEARFKHKHSSHQATTSTEFGERASARSTNAGFVQAQRTRSAVQAQAQAQAQFASSSNRQQGSENEHQHDQRAQGLLAATNGKRGSSTVRNSNNEHRVQRTSISKINERRVRSSTTDEERGSSASASASTVRIKQQQTALIWL